MEIHFIFAIIAFIIFLGYLSEYIFKRTNVPDVLFLIIAGIVIRTVFEWTTPESLGFGSELFTTFALIFLLFQGALNIKFGDLFASLSNVLKLTLTHFILSLVVSTAVIYFIEGSFLVSLVAGLIVAGTSSAIVIPLVERIQIRDKYKLILTLESAITDVLCIIGVLTVLEIFKSGNIDGSVIFQAILTSFALAIFVGVVVGILWIFILNKHQSLIDAHILTIGIVMAIYAFVESQLVGASGAIAALTFGIVLGNSKTILDIKNKQRNKAIEYRASKEKSIKKREEILENKVSNVVLNQSARSFYQEISFFIKIFFFVYIGILIDFSNPYLFLIGFLITIAIYLVRPFSVWVCFKSSELEKHDRVLLESLTPKGTAAVILAQFVAQSGYLGAFASDLISISLSVVVISILLTSMFVFLSKKKFFTNVYGFK
jgi:cell volume regulation protein A